MSRLAIDGAKIDGANEVDARITMAKAVAGRLTLAKTRALGANQLLQILHQAGKQMQAAMRWNNKISNPTTARLFVGKPMWLQLLQPFLVEAASMIERKGSVHCFLFYSEDAVIGLVDADFLEVEWPLKQIHAKLLCSPERPLVVLYNTTTMQMRVKFFYVARTLDGQVVTLPKQSIAASVEE
jgi:hypothetical protein